MKPNPKTFQLKTGTSINIRIPTVSEAQALVDLKRSYIKGTTTLPLTLDEYPDDAKKEHELIEEYHHSLNSIILVAEYDNELVGNIDLTGSKRSKMAHTAMLGMGIQKAWRNQGLGRILIESVIDWAKKQSDIEIIWLDVYATNELGYSLYKNTGFEVAGVMKNFFKENDNYFDKIQMCQWIKG